MIFWKLWRHNNSKIRVSKGLKSKYLQLWAEYSVRTPETPYRLSINGLLTDIGHLRCLIWPISWIYGPKGEKKSQNDQNQGLKGSKIKISTLKLLRWLLNNLPFKCVLAVSPPHPIHTMYSSRTGHHGLHVPPITCKTPTHYYVPKLHPLLKLWIFQIGEFKNFQINM